MKPPSNGLGRDKFDQSGFELGNVRVDPAFRCVTELTCMFYTGISHRLDLFIFARELFDL